MNPRYKTRSAAWLAETRHLVDEAWHSLREDTDRWGGRPGHALYWILNALDFVGFREGAD